jgi:hypothetical protein
MWTKTCFWCGFVGLLLAPSGCGTSSQDAADEFVANVCHAYDDCCAAAQTHPSVGHCRKFWAGYVSKSKFDPDAAAACLDAIKAQETDVKCGGYPPATVGCEAVFAPTPTKNPGEACETDTECQSPAGGYARCAASYINYIGADEQVVVSHCYEVLPGKLGSFPCVGFYTSDADLVYTCAPQDELYCDVMNVCQKRLAVRQPCDGNFACVEGAYCDRPNVVTPGICQPLAENGEACHLNDGCPQGSSCDAHEQTCTPLRALGERCSDETQCASKACIDAVCVPYNNAWRFLCAARGS